MDFESAEETALFLATALIYSEPSLKYALEAPGAAGSFPRTRISRGGFPLLARPHSDWTVSKALALTKLFPWEGIKDTIENGFFGTSVSLRQERGFCVRVYCNEAGQNRLREQSDALADRLFELPLDQIEIQLVESVKFAQSYKPVPGGSSISAQAGIEIGTLGGWLRDSNEQFVGISNNHVAADFNSFWEDEPIISPGGSGQVFGKLINAVPLRVDNVKYRIPNIADVAWLNYVDRACVDTSINGIDPVPTDEEDLVDDFFNKKQHTKIWMCGQKSGVVHGNVTAIVARVFLRGIRDYFFEDQIELDVGQPGDSGSLVLTETENKVGGLFFATKKDIKTGKMSGFANPWEDVKRASGLSFIYK